MNPGVNCFSFYTDELRNVLSFQKAHMIFFTFSYKILRSSEISNVKISFRFTGMQSLSQKRLDHVYKGSIVNRAFIFNHCRHFCCQLD